MDLNTISEIKSLKGRADLAAWKPGTSFLGGGTWLFSEPQPHLDTLLDLTTLGWEPLTLTTDGLRISATCTIAQLHAFAAHSFAAHSSTTGSAASPADWRATALIEACCKSLLGSFKVWNVATAGGNICLALPAAPMISLTAALEGTAVIWTPDGAERTLSICDFVTGAQRTALEPGEVLRAIDIPLAALRRSYVHKQVSLTTLGRSAALLIGTREANHFALTVTASIKRPVRIEFPEPPNPARLASALTAIIPQALYHDDLHGRPDWRRHLTFALAEDIRAELFDGAAA